MQYFFFNLFQCKMFFFSKFGFSLMQMSTNKPSVDSISLSLVFYLSIFKSHFLCRKTAAIILSRHFIQHSKPIMYHIEWFTKFLDWKWHALIFVFPLFPIEIISLLKILLRCTIVKGTEEVQFKKVVIFNRLWQKWHFFRRNDPKSGSKNDTKQDIERFKK